MSTLKLVTIIAKPSAPAEQTAPGVQKLTWLVSVSIDKIKHLDNVVLQNPWDATEKDDCCWLLEEHIQKYPFSVERAQKAAQSIDDYPKYLLKQLRLPEAVLERDKGEKFKIQINVADAPEYAMSGHTIHQLHWELLENASLWNIPCNEIVVRRTGKSSASETVQFLMPKSVSSWPPESSSNHSINILLIIARDTSRNSAQYQDVSPSLCLGLLTKLQEEFRARNSSTRLNIEVVRPGTIQALETHLLRSESLRGPGYFHIVHLDLHGAVRRLGLGRAAYLFFSSATSGGTVPQQAAKVGKILNHFRVEFVIMNACESARANAGDSANIAQSFKDEGIANVLAMSFKISSQSAEIFLRQFYEDLLLHGRTVASASADARKALHSAPKRHARFGLERELPDWFVPVYYCSERDLKFVEPDPPSLNGRLSSVDHAAIVRSQESEKALFGREFDLLRLEHAITTKRVVWLHGALGVGKTSFLENACRLWTATNFVEQVIFLDFKDQRIQSAAGLSEAILNRLHQGEDCGMDSCPQQAEDRSSLAVLQIKEHFRDSRIVLILDNIQASCTVFYNPLSSGEMDQINDLMSELIGYDLGIPSADGPVVIYAGRSGDAMWRQTFLGTSTEIQALELRGLELSDSIELAQFILRKHGMDLEHWTHSDLDVLDLVVCFLEGNPAALLAVLPTANSMGRWSDFYYSLHRGIIPWEMSECGIVETSVFHEFDYLFTSFREDVAACLMLLGMYWREGPSSKTISDVAKSFEVCSDPTNIESAICIAASWGFIEVDQFGLISWISPLFTFFMRTLAFAIVVSDSATGALPNPDPDHRSVTTALTNSALDTGAEELLHPLVVKTAQMLSIALDLEMEPFTIKSLSRAAEKLTPRIVLFESLDKLAKRKVIFNALKGLDLIKISSDFSSTIPNVLTAIQIIRRSAVDPSKWPKFLLLHAASIAVATATPAEGMLFASHYETLFDTFLEWNDGSMAVSPEHQHFVLNVVNFLATMHRTKLSVAQDQKRHNEYIEKAAQIVSESETKHGPMQSPLILYEKGYVLRHQTISEIERRRASVAVETWKRFLVVDRAMFAAMQSEIDEVKGESASLSQSMSDPKTADDVQRVASIMRYGLLIPYYHNRQKNSLAYIEKLAQVVESGVFLRENLFPALEAMDMGTAEMIGELGRLGVTGIGADIRNRGEGGKLATYFKTYDQPNRRLQALELATDSGNWAAVVEDSLSLMSEAVLSGNIGDAQEFINSVEGIYEKSPVFFSRIPVLHSQRKILSATSDLWRVLSSQGQPSDKSLYEAKMAVTRITTSMEATGASPDALDTARIIQQMWARDATEGFKQLKASMRHSTRGPKDRDMDFMRLLSQNSGDTIAINRIENIVLQVHKIYAQMQEANSTMDIGKLENAIALFPVLDQLAQTDAGRCCLEIDQIPHDKQLLEFKLQLARAMKAFSALANSERYLEAWKELNNLSKLLELEKELLDDVEQAEPKIDLRPQYILCESAIHEQLLQDGAKAFQSAKYSKAVEVYDTWLMMCLQEVFAHMERSKVMSASMHVILRRSKASELAAIQTKMPWLRIVFIFCLTFVEAWYFQVELLSWKFVGILATSAFLMGRSKMRTPQF